MNTDNKDSFLSTESTGTAKTLLWHFDFSFKDVRMMFEMFRRTQPVKA